MRDIIITLLLLGPLPYVVAHPYVGALMWVVIGVMNPHRLAWGFATNLPFAMLTAIATFAGLVFSKDRKRLPITPVTVTLGLFVLWMCITQVFAIVPEAGLSLWVRTMKIIGMTFVALMVLHTRQHVNWLIWSLMISLGYYGTKGGLFTILSGGAYRVWGPPSSFIEDNNALALAIIMAIPLAYYLYEQAKRKWVKAAIAAAMVLCAASALGSHSRGALLAIAAMGAFLWMKSRNKFFMGLILVMLVPVGLAFMPDHWFQRMETIATYEQDSSAMGRINAWWTAYYIARDRVTGAGFFAAHPMVFAQYAPDPTNPLAAHSIYFQVLGDHGFPGLALFLLVWFLTWRQATWIRKRVRELPEFQWAGSLANMIQVSLVAYAVGGAFLSLSYFDLPYYELVAIVIMRELVKEALAAKVTASRSVATRSFRPLPVEAPRSP